MRHSTEQTRRNVSLALWSALSSRPPPPPTRPGGPLAHTNTDRQADRQKGAPSPYPRRMSLDFLHWTKHVPGITRFWESIAAQVGRKALPGCTQAGRAERKRVHLAPFGGLREAAAWCGCVGLLGAREAGWQLSAAGPAPAGQPGQGA